MENKRKDILVFFILYIAAFMSFTVAIAKLANRDYGLGVIFAFGVYLYLSLSHPYWLKIKNTRKETSILDENDPERKSIIGKNRYEIRDHYPTGCQIYDIILDRYSELDEVLDKLNNPAQNPKLKIGK